MLLGAVAWKSGELSVNVGDLVEHKPEGSAVERILRKLASDEIDPDFVLGVVVEQQKQRCRIFSHQLPGVYWYDKSELKLID